MSDDEKKIDWKGYAAGVLALVVFTGLVWGALYLRILYASADTFEGTALVSPTEVLALENVHGGDGETSMPGGKRLVRLDVRTGNVLARKRCPHETFLGVYGGAVWLAHDDRTLVRRDPSSLSVAGIDAPGIANGLCFDFPSESVRFTASDGRHLAFSLTKRTTSPVEETSCAERDVTRAEAELDGMLASTRPMMGTSRLGLFDQRTPLDLSGLELRLLVDPAVPRSSMLTYRGLMVERDALLLRRITLDNEDGELVRFDPREKREVWVAKLSAVRSNPAAVLVTPGVLLYQDDVQLLALDPKTGTRLWRRGR